MLKMGFLRTSLHGLRIPLSPTPRISPHTTLHLLHDARTVALVVSRTYSTAPSSSKLVVRNKNIIFTLDADSFDRFHYYGYFDKTSHIPLIANGPATQLFCRPRKFGKTLTISMLENFHGVENLKEYDKIFKDLAVDRSVKKGEIIPGQHLTLKIDFSNHHLASVNAETTATNFVSAIDDAILKFVLKYYWDLGETFTVKAYRSYTETPVRNLSLLISDVHSALKNINEKGDKNHPFFGVKGIYLLIDEYDACVKQYIDPPDPGQSNTSITLLLKDFWAAVKAGKNELYGINKCWFTTLLIDKVFITGVTPLSDLTGDANDWHNITFHPQYSTLCGVTRSEALEALKAICKNEEEVQEHFRKLNFYAYGYHFSNHQKVEEVFNTMTALSYFKAIITKEFPFSVFPCDRREHSFRIDPPNSTVEDPPTSEVSKRFIEICAKAPAFVRDMQFALKKDEHGRLQKLQYENVPKELSLTELSTLAATGKGDTSAWRSLMVYMGGLTFDSDDPSGFLKIPNHIAADRFGMAILDRISLFNSLNNAPRLLKIEPDIEAVLAGYRQLIKLRDTWGFAYDKEGEEYHRDNIWHTILENPAITPEIEYRVRKWSNRKGCVDLLIEDGKNLYTALEFKDVKIYDLDIDGKTAEDKARQLEDMTLKDILKLRWTCDPSRPGTIEDWLDGDNHENEDYGQVREQLQSYITSQTLQKGIVGKNLRAFAVVIVGSRHILMREMGSDGKWVGEFQLA